MFDNQDLNSQAPKNLPTEPVDIFSGVDKNVASDAAQPATKDALDAGLLKKVDNSGPAVVGTTPIASQPVYNMRGPILGKILLGIIIIAILSGIGIGGWMLYDHFANPKIVTIEKSNVSNSESVVIPSGEAVVAPVSSSADAIAGNVSIEMANDTLLFGEAIDSDQDGLDDAREKELGTDPNNPDTDKDLLSDSDEVIIWKTDPLNPDTDGDKYPDGTEVRNGYNPLGPGKLFVASSTTSTK